MIAADGRAVVADFGMAVRTSVDGSYIAHAGTSIGGNAAHLAPEVMSASARIALGGGAPVVVQYAGQPVFAAGVLLWEMSTREHPIAGYPGV